MSDKTINQDTIEKLQVWKVIGVFALLFLALQVAVAILGVGINYIIRLINASENLRIFLGSTISRAGMIAAAILITAPAIRAVLSKPGYASLYPFKKGWGRDLLAGLGISTAAMVVIFLIELSFGWLKIENMALTSQPLDACLRALWLAILVNLTAAVGEEILFRGFLVNGLKDAWDASGALLISAVIFGGSHILVAGASETHWLEFIPLLALPGVMLGWAYLRTGNLWLATGLHFAWNLFQDDIFNLTGRTASDSLIGLKTTISGPKWFVGTSYGIEVGLAGIICLIIAGIGIWCWTQKRPTA